MPTSFATDIRPLFRDDPDIDTMQAYGLDLSSYEDVKAHAPEIYARLEEGSMPCDEAWPAERGDYSNAGWRTAWSYRRGENGTAAQRADSAVVLALALRRLGDPDTAEMRRREARETYEKLGAVPLAERLVEEWSSG